MADRVSASITIGGNMPGNLLDTFLAIIQNEGLPTEWDGAPFDPSELPQDEPLRLLAHEVAWGRLEKLEAFCLQNTLPFACWSGSHGGDWGAERTVFTGAGEPQCYAADEDDYVLIGRGTPKRLGSYAAIIAHFDAADFVVPPLVFGDTSPPEDARK